MLLAMRSSRPRFDPDAVAVWSSFSTPPSDSDKTNINNLVVALKEAGVWSELDVLYVLAAANSNAATKNWKAPGTFSLSLVNSPTFTAYRGFTGDGSSAYLNTGWTPSIHGVKFTKNDASLWAWSRLELAETRACIGDDVTPRSSLYPRTAAGNLLSYLNTDGIGNVNVAVGSSVGLSGAQRRASNDVRGWRNGSQVGSTSTGASTAIADQAQWVCGAANAGFSNQQIALAAWGASLSGKESAFYAAVHTYLTAVGAI